MAFDVNKIIMESLQDIEEQQIVVGPLERTVGKWMHDRVQDIKGTYDEFAKNVESYGSRAYDIKQKYLGNQPIQHTAQDEARLIQSKTLLKQAQKNKAMREQQEAKNVEQVSQYPTDEDYKQQEAKNVEQVSQYPTDEDYKQQEAKNVEQVSQYPTDEDYKQQEAKNAAVGGADEAKDTASGAAGTAARKAVEYDPNVGLGTYLRRAINRAGQQFGVEKSKWDTEAGSAGVQTHLAHAGKRLVKGIGDLEPQYTIPAAAIAAGLGALGVTKAMRRKRREQEA